MLRKRAEQRPITTELLTTKVAKNRNKQSPILPPSPKSINDMVVDPYENAETDRTIPCVQNSSAMFDPNGASPASNFMDLLKLRMSIYYEPEMDILGR